MHSQADDWKPPSGEGRFPTHCGHQIALAHWGVRDRDYTPEAEALFGRLAERYDLKFEVEEGVPMQVCWTFPVQPNLSRPITLGLQNLDELNFGVGGLWTYFFPFPNHAERFEQIVGAWIEGNGRVAVTGAESCNLQILEGPEWKTVYSQNGCVWFFWMRPKRYLMNETPPLRPPMTSSKSASQP